MTQYNAFSTSGKAKKGIVPTVTRFMAANGMIVGGASLALGMIMMGGTMLSQSGLKADMTATTNPTPTALAAVSPEVVQASALPSETVLAPEVTAVASQNQTQATSSTTTSSTSSSATASSTSVSSGSVQVVTLEATPESGAAQMVIEKAPIALTAPAPNDEHLRVPAGLLQVTEAHLNAALQEKKPEILAPAEMID